MNKKSSDQILKNIQQEKQEILYIGEIQDTKKIHAALQMAEIGHLVMTSVSGLLKPVVIDKKRNSNFMNIDQIVKLEPKIEYIGETRDPIYMAKIRKIIEENTTHEHIAYATLHATSQEAKEIFERFKKQYPQSEQVKFWSQSLEDFKIK